MKKQDAGSVLEGTQDAEILERLSARVEQAVSVIETLRRERDELRGRVEELEGELTRHRDDADRLGGVSEENEKFRAERDEIRNRIESVLGRLDALEGAAAE